MAYVKKDGSNFSFINWVDGSEWKNPNDGAMLVSVENIEDHDPTGNDGARDIPQIPDANSYNLLHPVQSIPSGSGCSIGHEALIFSPYGGIVGHDRPLYFTVTEAKYNSGYELPNPDNFLVLKLNSITGRVSYFDPHAE